MKAKKIAVIAFSASFLLPSLTMLSGCASNDIILRVYNWEEYIDVGGEDSYAATEEDPEPLSVVKEFEKWYEETYGASIRVEYSTFGTNEDMYNQLKLGNTYDLVCPSEYMIMKLAAEGMLEPLSDEFHDPEKENNYYAQYVSDFIAERFEAEFDIKGTKHKWKDFAAGYMWGTTGLIYNPSLVNETDLAEGWEIMLNPDYRNKVTAKDNVRDTYFVGLAIYHKMELLNLKQRFEAQEISRQEYTREVTRLMNDTTEETIKNVQKILLDIKKNIFGFETDTGKSDMVTGKIRLNFAWSGDGVYAMDLAEEKGVLLNYYIPQESANLFFDGWVMPKGAKTEAAEAFINFMSKPEIAVRNMDYIGYSSVIAGEEIFEYTLETYGADEDEEETVEYDLSYFFGENAVITAAKEQMNRQLYAQYPPEEVTYRCAVMDHFGEDDAKINELWTKVKSESLDGWAIAVICIAAAVIVAVVLLSKFGGKIDIFRPKPKKGYELVKQESLRK